MRVSFSLSALAILIALIFVWGFDSTESVMALYACAGVIVAQAMTKLSERV